MQHHRGPHEVRGIPQGGTAERVTFATTVAHFYRKRLENKEQEICGIYLPDKQPFSSIPRS